MDLSLNTLLPSRLRHLISRLRHTRRLAPSSILQGSTRPTTQARDAAKSEHTSRGISTGKRVADPSLKGTPLPSKPPFS